MLDLKRKDGVVIGLVSNIEDPEQLGRVKVKFPNLKGEPESDWCRTSTPMAGAEHGFYYAPEIDSEALVAFEHGDFNKAYIVGYLWNGDTALPGTEPQQRVIKSVKGNTIILDDRDDEESITLEDMHGNAIIMNRDGIEIRAKKITLTADEELQAVGNPINLNP